MKRPAMLLFVPILAIGCQATGDPPIAHQTEASSAGRLPSPRVLLSPAKVWTKPAQQARAKEVEAYLLANRYAGFRIMDTVQSAHGTVIDFVDARTVGAVATDAPPPPKNAPNADNQAKSETEESPELRGPRAPFRSFVPTSAATSLATAATTRSNRS